MAQENTLFSSVAEKENSVHPNLKEIFSDLLLTLILS